ncbi:putative reverse transcriptase domain-containing protein [Tanacetum coccineum]|uniref:Reverse transcriptase domain-containing protein n=1 Tax=Tanacetum coccineum TaxID=301880 RepID=A0ABQ5FW59_9ASTR
MKEKKVNIAPIDYVALNKLPEHFVKHFVPQKQLSAEQAFWLPISKPVSEIPLVQHEPVLKEIPRGLPIISLVKDSFNKMGNHVNDFENVVTVRTKVTSQNEERKSFDIEEKELLLENDRLLELIISQDLVHTDVNSLAEILDYKSMEKRFLDEYSECVELKAELSKKNKMVEKAIFDELLKRCAKMENKSHLQAKDNSISKLKEHIATLMGKCMSEGNKSDNISKVIAPRMYKLDFEPLSPKLLRNKEAHVDYLKHTQENANTLHEIVKQARELRPLDNDLDSACKFAKRIQELLVYVSATCPSLNKQSEKLIAVTPINKNKKVRLDLHYRWKLLVSSASALQALRRLGSIFTSVYAADQKLKKAYKVYKAGKRLLYVKRNKAISFRKGTSKVGIEVQQLSLKDYTWNAIGTHYLPHSSEYVAPPSIDIVRQWFETIGYRETVSAKGTLKKILLPFSPTNLKDLPSQTTCWLYALQLSQWYSKAPKPSSNVERVSQGIKPEAQPGHKKHSTSSKQPFVSSQEATKGKKNKGLFVEIMNGIKKEVSSKENDAINSMLHAIDYDLEDESLVCSTPLPPLEKLAGAKPVHERKSTSGAYQFLGGKFVCWSAKKQQSVAMSSADVEYVATTRCCANTLWMKSQLTDYDIIYERYHILKRDIELHFIPTQYQLADIFTKPLDEQTFKRLIVELEPSTRSPNMYKEYLLKFWNSAKALENSKVSFSILTGGIYGEVGLSQWYLKLPNLFNAESQEATKGGSSKAPTRSKTGHLKKQKDFSSTIESNLSQTYASTPMVTEMHKEDEQATGGPNSLGVTSEERADPRLSSANSTAEVNPGKSAPSDFIPQQQGMNKGTKNTSYDHLFAGTDPHVLANQTQSVSEGLETILTQSITDKGAFNIAKQIEKVEASRTIKLEDLAKLMRKQTKMDFMLPQTLKLKTLQFLNPHVTSVNFKVAVEIVVVFLLLLLIFSIDTPIYGDIRKVEILYRTSKSCGAKKFFGTERAVGLLSWLEEMNKTSARMITPESKRTDRYIRGLASAIRGNNGNQAVSKEEHEVHLKLILELLKKEKLFRKFSKCEFWLQEIRFLRHVVNSEGKANIVADALSRKERLKPRRARAMSMTIHSSIKDRILEAQSEASKGVNTPAEMLKGLDRQFERKENGRLYLAKRIWVPVYGNLITLIMNEAHATRLQMERFASLYIEEIVPRHDVPMSIISDCDSYFTSRFWQSLHKSLGTRPNMSTAYHPQTDGQSEHTIKTLEDMHRACAIDFEGNWDTHLPLVEFSYNNSYHSSVKCAPFEALYGRKYRTPIAWTDVGESKLIRLEIIQETTDKIVQIKERLKETRDRQKSYADNRRKPLEFSVGDKVLLQVSPKKGVVRFGKRSKLSPRCVGPFEIVERVGHVAYRLRLPQELVGIHDMFHVSNLKKCLADLNFTYRVEESTDRRQL